jgi:hypothetical protein
MFMSLISTFRKGRSMASWEEFFERTVLGEGWYTNVELADKVDKSQILS